MGRPPRIQALRSALLGGGLAMALCAAATATTWYADAGAAVDGDGSAGLPWNTLAHLAAVQSGDTLYLAGSFHEKILINGVADLTIRTWPGGTPRAMIRGDRPVPTALWWPTAGGGYWTQLDSGLAIASVVWNWDENLTVEQPPREPRHFGHLHQRFSQGQVEANPGSWYYDASTGHLFVSTPPVVGALAPDVGDTYAWCAGGNAIMLLNATGCDVGDLDIALYSEFAGSRGYGVLLGGGGVGPWNNTVHDMTIWDCGYHAVGFVDRAGDGNVMRNIVSKGQNTNGTTVSNPFVYFTIRDATTGNAGEGLIHHAYTLLDFEGQKLRQPARFVTLNSHTDTIARITDLAWRSVSAFTYDPEDIVGLIGSNHAVAATDPADPETYPVRVYDSVVRTPRQLLETSGSDIAFIRTEFDSLGQAGAAPPTQTMIVRDGDRMLLESCLVKAQRTGSPLSTVLSVADGAHLHLTGTTVFMEGTDGVMVTLQSGAVPGSMVTARQCLFVRSAPGTLGVATATTDTGHVDLQDCWYDQVSPAAYFLGAVSGGGTGVRTLADMQSNVDADGLYDVDPMFNDPPLDLEGAPGGPLRTVTRWLDGRRPRGINQRTYSGHFGAYQYGPDCPGDVNADGAVDVDDLVLVITSWGLSCPPEAGPCPGDADGDGEVDVDDLSTVILSWGPCP
jgi:hypothetical protein